MENPGDKDYPAEYFALKAANDQLRERGKQWLLDTLNQLSSEIAQELIGLSDRSPLQLGRQDWEFRFDGATMIGERFGARYGTRTLTIEVGWPRLPEHGFVSGGGLACARVGVSQNTMLEVQTVAELSLKRVGRGEPAWYVITNKKPGEQLTEGRLRDYLNLILAKY